MVKLFNKNTLKINALLTDKLPLTHFIISKALTRGLAGHPMYLSIRLLGKCCEKTGVYMCLLERGGAI